MQAIARRYNATGVKLKVEEPQERSLSAAAAAHLAGAPLDFIKLMAAAFMVVDHVNAIFLNKQFNGFWMAGRVAFPLFCFVVAYNLRSGAALGKYAASLVLLGLISQPITFEVLAATDLNVLFTLAAGAVLVTALRRQATPVQHLAFLCAAAATFVFHDPTRSFINYGLTGMLLPAAFFFVLDGRWSHIPWLICLLLGLNWYGPDPWQFAPVMVFLIVIAGLAATLALSTIFARRRRFLARYALYVFYPGHLVLLAVLHGLVRYAA